MEALSSREGIPLRKVGFDTPEGQALTRKFRVLSIPTTLWVRSEDLIGRVEGYGNRTVFLQNIEELIVSGGTPRGIPLDDGEPSLARVRSLLLNGEGERGVELGQTLLLNSEPTKALKVAKLLARYFIRVAGEPDAGVRVLQNVKMGREIEGSGGGVYWLAKGLYAMEQEESVYEVLDSWIHENEGNVSSHLLRASFLHLHGLYGARLLESLHIVVAEEPQNASVHFLLANHHLREKRLKEARAEASRALEFNPSRAQYRVLVEQINARMADGDSMGAK